MAESLALNALRCFDAVATCKSMTQAGEQLNVTHGAISRQIRQLEASLGVELFERKGRGLELTAAGAVLYEHTRPALEQLARGCELARTADRQRAFVLSCPGSFLARWFIPRLDRLNQECPELELHLTASDRTDWPLRQGVDAMLCYATPPWPATAAVHVLANERIGPVMSPQLAADLDQSDPQQVMQMPRLHTQSRPHAWHDWCQLQGITTEQKSGQQFEHLNYMLEAALVGLGVAIAPDYLVAEDMRLGRLVAPWGFVDTPARLTLWSRTDVRADEVEKLHHWLQSELNRIKTS